MKKHLHNSLRTLYLCIAVLMSLPVLAQKINLKELKLIDNVRELSINEGLGDITVPAHVKHVVNNKAMKAPTRAGNTNSYEAMAGEWEMTTASGRKWNVTVHAAAENDPDYNKVLYVTGMMGYDWTVLTMPYSYNFEEGKPEVYIKAGELFAEGVNFSGVGVCDIYLYNVVGNYLTTQDFAATVSADGMTIDFGESTFTGVLFSGDTFTGYFWFRETGVKMTQKRIVNHNGVYYSLSVGTMQATVIKNADGMYSGEIVIPESVNYNGTTYSVTSIGDDAFAYCSGLTSVTIPNSVTSIGDDAFYGCSALTSVTIGNGVTSIGEYAFSDCSGLTEMKVDANNPKYDSRENCNAIIETSSNTLIYGCQTTVIPNSVTSIGSHAFDGCSGLTSVTIGNSVTSIGEYAFRGCSGLTSVTIPNSVTSIGEGAFIVCFGLKSVTIPNSVESIGTGAFSSCYGLTEMKVDANNPKYDSRENCNAIIETSSNTLISGCQTTVIPNSVTSIGGYAFYYCESLTSVTIPNSVTSIGYYAFAGCSALTSVTIGNSVTSIGDYAFYGCSALTSVTIGSGVTSIGVRAFYKCESLQDVYCYAEKVPDAWPDSDNGHAFSISNYKNATLHVPAGSIESYKSTEPWSEFGNIVALTEEETGIDELKGENANVKTAVYDLSGRRVQKAQKGIYVVNGKKVLK